MGTSANSSDSAVHIEKGRVIENDLTTEILEFVKQKFPLARKRQIQNSDALLESGMLDSQGILEVVTFIESEFSVVVDDEDLVPTNFQTVEQIADFVRKKRAGAA